MHKPRTADERYILELYQLAYESGDIHTPFDKYEVGKKASLNPKGVNAICKLLLQANFIKKSSQTDIYMTTHGEKLAQRLLME